MEYLNELENMYEFIIPDQSDQEDVSRDETTHNPHEQQCNTNAYECVLYVRSFVQ